MSVIAVVPARGGSKGIHRKNLRLLNGVPLVVHAIQHAQRARLIDRVIVSTEDEEIAAVSRDAGAEVPFLRPAELATDDALDLGVFQHVLDYLQQREGLVPELLVQVRPTSPVRRPVFLDLSVRRMLERPEVDSLRSISPVAQTPYKMWHWTRGSLLEPAMNCEAVPDWFDMPRQALPPVFIQDGLVDVVRPGTVTGLRTMAGTKLLGLFHAEPAIDIDDATALTMADTASGWCSPDGVVHRHNVFVPVSENLQPETLPPDISVIAEVSVAASPSADLAWVDLVAPGRELILRCDELGAPETSPADGDLRALGDLARKTGARRIVAGVRDTVAVHQVAMRMRKQLRSIADYLSGQGVEFCLDWGIEPALLYEVLGIIGHPKINVCVRVGVADRCGDSGLDDFELLSHRIGILYVNGCGSAFDQHESGLPKILRRLESGLFRGDVVVIPPSGASAVGDEGWRKILPLLKAGALGENHG